MADGDERTIGKAASMEPTDPGCPPLSFPERIRARRVRWQKRPSGSRSRFRRSHDPDDRSPGGRGTVVAEGMDRRHRVRWPCLRLCLYVQAPRHVDRRDLGPPARRWRTVPLELGASRETSGLRVAEGARVRVATRPRVSAASDEARSRIRGSVRKESDSAGRPPEGGALVLETPRLVLRTMSLADDGAVAAMLTHPAVMRYWRRCCTHEEVLAWIERQQARY